MNAGPPLLRQRCPGGNLTLHKLRWSGCKRFTSGHRVVGTVSGVDAAIHGGDELWFGVGIEVVERDQNVDHHPSPSVGAESQSLQNITNE